MISATDRSTLFVLRGAAGALGDMVQTLLYEVLAGDRGLFVGVDQIEAACTLLQLLLDAWGAYPEVLIFPTTQTAAGVLRPPRDSSVATGAAGSPPARWRKPHERI